MRTTVTLDPDVEALLRRTMRERDLSFKEALNSAIRQGLSNRKSQATTKTRIRTFRMGFDASFRWDKALALAASLEDEELVRKLELRK
jgi:hypothetical protein